MTGRPWCCFIAEDGTRCPRLAKWEAYWYPDHAGHRITTDTHACDTHLGKLLPNDRQVYVSALEVTAIDALADLAVAE